MTCPCVLHVPLFGGINIIQHMYESYVCMSCNVCVNYMCTHTCVWYMCGTAGLRMSVIFTAKSFPSELK
jgi:hypothetical protein